MGANCTRWLERLPTGSAAVAVWPEDGAPGVVVPAVAGGVAGGMVEVSAAGGVVEPRVEAVLQPARTAAAISPAIAGNKRLTNPDPPHRV
jgi:hypothetical protein